MIWAQRWCLPRSDMPSEVKIKFADRDPQKINKTSIKLIKFKDMWRSDIFSWIFLLEFLKPPFNLLVQYFIKCERNFQFWDFFSLMSKFFHLIYFERIKIVLNLNVNYTYIMVLIFLPDCSLGQIKSLWGHFGGQDLRDR